MENEGNAGKAGVFDAITFALLKAILTIKHFPRKSIAYCLLPGLLFVSFCQQQDPKFQQYYTHGEELYTRHCANCHQKSGKGLGLVYPPLDRSDYMEQSFDDVICQMKYGVKGELIVNRESFNQPMPGVRSLTPLEIAEISTYIYNTWGHRKGIIEVPEVEKALQKCDY